MPKPPPTTGIRPLRSYLLRVVEQRTVVVSQVYELHDIAAGTRRRFVSLDELKQYLGRKHARDAI